MNTEFATEISESGHHHHMVGFLSNTNSRSSIVSREAYLDQVETKIRRSRGRELPGLFNPMIMADLFRDQASPWGGVVYDHIGRVWRACKRFLQHVVLITRCRYWDSHRAY